MIGLAKHISIKGGPGSGPRPHSGDKVSDSAFHMAFHGTHGAAIEGILKDGIVPGASGNRNYGSNFYYGDRKDAVFGADNRKDALQFASDALLKHISDKNYSPYAVIFKLALPSSIYDKTKPDESAGRSTFYYKGSIPAKCIMGYDLYVPKGKDWELSLVSHHDVQKSADVKIFYVPVIFFKTEEKSFPAIVTKTKRIVTPTDKVAWERMFRKITPEREQEFKKEIQKFFAKQKAALLPRIKKHFEEVVMKGGPGSGRYPAGSGDSNTSGLDSMKSGYSWSGTVYRGEGKNIDNEKIAFLGSGKYVTTDRAEAEKHGDVTVYHANFEKVLGYNSNEYDDIRSMSVRVSEGRVADTIREDALKKGYDAIYAGRVLGIAVLKESTLSAKEKMIS